jgi:hypothetical protein
VRVCVCAGGWEATVAALSLESFPWVHCRARVTAVASPLTRHHCRVTFVVSLERMAVRENVWFTHPWPPRL